MEDLQDELAPANQKAKSKIEGESVRNVRERKRGTRTGARNSSALSTTTLDLSILQPTVWFQAFCHRGGSGGHAMMGGTDPKLSVRGTATLKTVCVTKSLS